MVKPTISRIQPGIRFCRFSAFKRALLEPQPTDLDENHWKMKCQSIPVSLTHQNANPGTFFFNSLNALEKKAPAAAQKTPATAKKAPQAATSAPFEDV